jgi:hypothetical protein
MYLFLFLAAAVVSADEDIGLCCLCPSCEQAVPGRGGLLVTSDGMTCDMMSLHMADPTNDSTQGSSACGQLQNDHRLTCCDRNYVAIPVAQAPQAEQVVNM